MDKMNSASRININASVRETTFAVSSFGRSVPSQVQFDSGGNFIHYSQDFSGGTIEILLNASAGQNTGQRCILNPGESYMGRYNSFSVGCIGSAAAGVLHYGENFSLSRVGGISNNRTPAFSSLSSLDVPFNTPQFQIPKATPRNVFAGQLVNQSELTRTASNSLIFSGFLSLVHPSRIGGVNSNKTKVKAIVIKNMTLVVYAKLKFTESIGTPNAPPEVMLPPRYTSSDMITPDGNASVFTDGYQGTSLDVISHTLTYGQISSTISTMMAVAVYKSSSEVIILPSPNFNLPNLYNPDECGINFYSLGTKFDPNLGGNASQIRHTLQGDIINLL